tara:strand:- start:746 stop:2470 length:1725 start_codon:yes stop_codon:yes gene_type:complete
MNGEAPVRRFLDSLYQIAAEVRGYRQELILPQNGTAFEALKAAACDGDAGVKTHPPAALLHEAPTQAMSNMLYATDVTQGSVPFRSGRWYHEKTVVEWRLAGACIFECTKHACRPALLLVTLHEDRMLQSVVCYVPDAPLGAMEAELFSPTYGNSATDFEARWHGAVAATYRRMRSLAHEELSGKSTDKLPEFLFTGEYHVQRPGALGFLRLRAAKSQAEVDDVTSTCNKFVMLHKTARREQGLPDVDVDVSASLQSYANQAMQDRDATPCVMGCIFDRKGLPTPSFETTPEPPPSAKVAVPPFPTLALFLLTRVNEHEYTAVDNTVDALPDVDASQAQHALSAQDKTASLPLRNSSLHCTSADSQFAQIYKATQRKVSLDRDGTTQNKVQGLSHILQRVFTTGACNRILARLAAPQSTHASSALVVGMSYELPDGMGLLLLECDDCLLVRGTLVLGDQKLYTVQPDEITRLLGMTHIHTFEVCNERYSRVSLANVSYCPLKPPEHVAPPAAALPHAELRQLIDAVADLGQRLAAAPPAPVAAPPAPPAPPVPPEVANVKRMRLILESHYGPRR